MVGHGSTRHKAITRTSGLQPRLYYRGHLGREKPNSRPLAADTWRRTSRTSRVPDMQVKTGRCSCVGENPGAQRCSKLGRSGSWQGQCCPVRPMDARSWGATGSIPAEGGHQARPGVGAVSGCCSVQMDWWLAVAQLPSLPEPLPSPRPPWRAEAQTTVRRAPWRMGRQATWKQGGAAGTVCYGRRVRIKSWIPASLKDPSNAKPNNKTPSPAEENYGLSTRKARRENAFRTVFA